MNLIYQLPSLSSLPATLDLQTGEGLLVLDETARPVVVTATAIIPLQIEQERLLASASIKPDDPAFDSAAGLAAKLAGGGLVLLPKGAVRINSTLTIPQRTTLRGHGAGVSFLDYYGTGTALQSELEARQVKIYDVTIRCFNAASTTQGILLRQARQCWVRGVEVLDFDRGILLDGLDTWCASNHVKENEIGRCRVGITLTANAGKQTNHTAVRDNYIYGSDTIKANTTSAGIIIERGDSNILDNNGVENLHTGIVISAADFGGNSLIFNRPEDCTSPYGIAAGVSFTLNIGGFAGLEIPDPSGNGQGVGNLGLKPRVSLENTWYPSGGGIFFRDSGGALMRLIEVSDAELKILTPTFNSASKVGIWSRGDGVPIVRFGRTGTDALIEVTNLPTAAPSGAGKLYRSGNDVKITT